MIVIVGMSGSGKSTIENMLKKNGFQKIVSYTTREPRPGETNGIDYTFITKEQFLNMLENNNFAEHTFYNNNYYGIIKKDCVDNAVAVVELNGLKQLQSNKDLDIFSVAVTANVDDRFIRMLKRGDTFYNALKRIESDAIVFKELDVIYREHTKPDELDIDWVIYNVGDIFTLGDQVHELISGYRTYKAEYKAEKEEE